MSALAAPRGRRTASRPSARLLLALALIAWGVGEALTLDGAWPVAARIAFVAAVLLPITLAGRWPWAVVLVLAAGIAIHLSQEVMIESVTPLQGIVIAGWIAGAAVPRRWPSVAALAGVLALMLVAAQGLPPFGIVVATLLGWAGARAVGGVRGRNEEAKAVLRAARAEGGGLRAAELEDERGRLARELDAAVLRAARAIEQDARRGQALLAREPARAKELLRQIAGAASAAMEQMRRALAVLRADAHDDDGAEPLPDGFETALARLRELGVPVALRDGAGPHDPSATLAATRALEALAASGWRPPRLALRRDRRGVLLRIELATAPTARRRPPLTRTATPRLARRRAAGDAPTPEQRLALTRIAERARLHGGALRVRPRPRPHDLRARVAEARLPALEAPARRGPGTAGFVAAAIAGVATVVDVVTGHAPAIAPGDEPTALGIAVCATLTTVVVAGAWTRTTAGLMALALLPLARALPVGFVGLDVTSLPLMALTAFLTPLWLRGLGQRVAVGGTLAAATVGVMVMTSTVPLVFSDVAIALGSCAIPWLIALAVRDAADETEQLTALRWATAREELLTAQAAVDDERRRVARDLHDLVGHGLALVSVQAWGAERALPADPARAADGLAAIRRVLSGAVAELERLVTPWEEERPAPLDDVEALVGEARRAGLPVTLGSSLDGAVRAPAEVLAGVPPEQREAARRIVQEALTNVLRHAGPTPTAVALRRADGALEVEIVNAPAAGGAAGHGSGGRGLPGMRERVAALGGSCSAAPRADGGFAVRARLPLAPPAAAAPAPRAVAPTTGPGRPARRDG